MNVPIASYCMVNYSVQFHEMYTICNGIRVYGIEASMENKMEQQSLQLLVSACVQV